MKKGVLLYYVTAAWALMMVVIGLHFLFSSMQPTTDVKSKYQSRLHAVSIENWEPGTLKRLRIEGRPVVIWRRSPIEIAKALTQADPTIPLEDWAEALNDGSLADALGPEDFARVEWLIVSPISPSGFGCIVLSKAGDYEGFFDPCRGAHFDAWGRLKKGPSDENLKTHPVYFTEDGSALLIEPSKLPRPR